MIQEMKQVVDDCINNYTDQLVQFDQEMVIKALTCKAPIDNIAKHRPIRTKSDS